MTLPRTKISQQKKKRCQNCSVTFAVSVAIALELHAVHKRALADAASESILARRDGPTLPAPAVVVQALVRLHSVAQADWRVSGLFVARADRLQHRRLVQLPSVLPLVHNQSRQDRHVPSRPLSHLRILLVLQYRIVHIRIRISHTLAHSLNINSWRDTRR
jgi:hypothetical protein